MIMVCYLDSETYSSPRFMFCRDEDTARKYIKDLCEEEGYSIKGEEDNIFYADKIGDDHYWCVFQCFEVSNDYVVVVHHAYDGVDFDIVGEFDNFFKAKDAMVLDVFDHYKTCSENQRTFEWLDDRSAGIDTGNEWEVWNIVKVPTVEFDETKIDDKYRYIGDNTILDTKINEKLHPCPYEGCEGACPYYVYFDKYGFYCYESECCAMEDGK